MKRLCWCLAILALLALPILGCGTRIAPDRTTGSVNGPTASDPPPAGKGTIDATAEPAEARQFLAEHGIASGDIFLQDGKVYLNIVGLNDSTKRLLADHYLAGTYRTVNVAHSIEELQAAQEKLTSDVFTQLNLYSSGIDVIRNKITIEMPEESAAQAKQAIEKLIDPDLIIYDIQPLADKDAYVGKIVKLDSGQQRILLLVDGEKEPSIYFRISDRSIVANVAGDKIAFADLKKGQRVRAWAAGGIDDSMPAQAGARKVELLAE